MQFGKATAGFAYSALRYELGQEFESLGAHGTQQVASLYSSYPVIRSRRNNLYVGLALDSKRFEDQVDSTNSSVDKRSQVVMVNLHGDHLDNGGTSAFALTWSSGNIDLQDSAMQAIDAASAQSSGHFNKLGFSVTGVQAVSDTLSVSAAISGQVASKNLDVSEKMELGGMYAVRAYPEGEAYADQGYVVTLEARLQLPMLSDKVPGQLQLIGFVDAGRVDINKAPWAAGENRRTLSGAGLGLNWSERNNFMVRAYYAFKLGDEVARSAPDASGRFWIQAVKYF
jgi:hemolysin activation/secretion protein